MSEENQEKALVDAGQESDGEAEEKGGFNSYMQSPAFLSGIMRRQVLKSMVKSLPDTVQKRLKALKNLQLDYFGIETKFYEEVYELEKKYQALYTPILEKRRDIVNGTYEPSGAEIEFQSDHEEDDELAERMNELSAEFKNTKQDYAPDVKGVPDFWLKIFRNVTLISDMVQEHDEVVLKKLKDVCIKYADDGMSYTLEFYFEPNEHFTNEILTKQYFLKAAIEKDDPFSFEGTEIYKCFGCVINWNKGMNLTVKTIRKKQKHKARGAVRTITKQVPNDSFFNFFTPPEVPEDDTKIDSENENLLASDFEIGHFLRSRVIPKAVLYFTGDVVDDDDDDLEEEEEEDAEDEDDDLEGGECDKYIEKIGGSKKENPPECRQQ
ncbi:nucleosome assembly protein 1-like 1-B [Phlebotomus papatasi]|uniref:nucleosome assembly protein 1-like 1-B n=1 Tax=Phlebotomus papatasi TaxID=29031 RepID=UPI002484634B|nr:nucleosome assembly protein 1-like 1-B [Phlebotomus papatasi]XP_055706236.1 nucleosome assembly protein 1-like 1-B [Phlebotomus papatasi]